MFNQTQAFREYLNRRQDIMNSEKSKEASSLFNEKTFYSVFVKDLLEAKKEVIIYSPFASKFRTDFYQPTIEKLRKRNIEVFIFTRPLEEYEEIFRPQIERSLQNYEKLGVNIFYLGKYIHEKVAIIDRKILWEGSLNILSHRASNEMMRRTANESSAMQVMSCLGLNKKLTESYKHIYERLCQNLINDSKQNLIAKIQIFFLGFITAMIYWWLFIIFGDKILLFQWIKLIIKALH